MANDSTRVNNFITPLPQDYQSLQNSDLNSTNNPMIVTPLNSSTKQSTKSKPRIIRNHDNKYDYYVDGDTIMTRRKGSKEWIDISDNDTARKELNSFARRGYSWNTNSSTKANKSNSNTNTQQASATTSKNNSNTAATKTDTTSVRKTNTETINKANTTSVRKAPTTVAKQQTQTPKANSSKKQQKTSKQAIPEEPAYKTALRNFGSDNASKAVSTSGGVGSYRGSSDNNYWKQREATIEKNVAKSKGMSVAQYRKYKEDNSIVNKLVSFLRNNNIIGTKGANVSSRVSIPNKL